MNNRRFLSGTATAIAAAIIAGAGGYWARASADHGAVNSPEAMSATQVAPGSFADIVEKVAPAVVSIDVVEKAGPVLTQGAGGEPFWFQFGPGQNGGQGNPFGFDFRQFFPQTPQGGQLAPVRAAGSGFFISPDGYILTDDHVVEGARKITVHTKDGRELDATIVGTDPPTDLAVIRVAGDSHPYVSFEDRAKPRVGDWVVAVGNPFGLGGTATAGIVSALGRENLSNSSYVNYMQIDAPINHGNSGGPTFDVYGRVVGINSAIYSPSGGSVGIGFDIPADVAASVSQALIEHGRVVRGYIGATIQNVTPDIAASLGVAPHSGALVAETVPGGPAALAGLAPGDLILRVDGRPVSSAGDLTREVAQVRPGQNVTLQINRDGHAEEINVRSSLRPSEATLASNPGALGSGGDGSQGSVLVCKSPPTATEGSP